MAVHGKNEPQLWALTFSDISEYFYPNDLIMVINEFTNTLLEYCEHAKEYEKECRLSDLCFAGFLTTPIAEPEKFRYANQLLLMPIVCEAILERYLKLVMFKYQNDKGHSHPMISTGETFKEMSIYIQHLLKNSINMLSMLLKKIRTELVNNKFDGGSINLLFMRLNIFKNIMILHELNKQGLDTILAVIIPNEFKLTEKQWQMIASEANKQKDTFVLIHNLLRRELTRKAGENEQLNQEEIEILKNVYFTLKS